MYERPKSVDDRNEVAVKMSSSTMCHDQHCEFAFIEAIC